MSGRILETQGGLPLEAVGFGIAAGNRLTLEFSLACDIYQLRNHRQSLKLTCSFKAKSQILLSSSTLVIQTETLGAHQSSLVATLSLHCYGSL